MSKTGCMKENRAKGSQHNWSFGKVAGMPNGEPHITAEEERELIVLAQSGGPSSVAARDRLWRAHLGFWLKTARAWMPYVEKGYEFDDVFQHTIIAVMRAIEGFDVSTNYRLTTYAKSAIDREIQKLRHDQGVIYTPAPYGVSDEWKQDWERAKRISSVDQTTSDGKSSVATRLAGEANVIQDVVHNEMVDLLNEAVQSIPKERWRFIIRSYLAGNHVAEIARQIGVRRQAVDHQLFLAKREVHKYLEEHYGDFIRDQFGQDCFNRFFIRK